MIAVALSGLIAGVDNAAPAMDIRFRAREIMKFAVDEANGD